MARDLGPGWASAQRSQGPFLGPGPFVIGWLSLASGLILDGFDIGWLSLVTDPYVVFMVVSHTTPKVY